MILRESYIELAYIEWDKLRARPGVKMADGERCYQAEKGGSSSHPSNGFLCKVELGK